MNDKEWKEFLEAIAKVPLKVRLVYLEKALKEEKDKEMLKKIEQEIEKIKAELLEAREWKKEGALQDSQPILLEKEEREETTDIKQALRARSLENLLMNVHQPQKEENQEMKYSSKLSLYDAESGYKSASYEGAKYKSREEELAAKPEFYIREQQDRERMLVEPERLSLTGIEGKEAIEKSREFHEVKYKKKENDHH